MITRFIIFVGLPGSGKTTTALKLYETMPEALFLDDLCLDVDGGARKYKELMPETVIITDPRMCGTTQENVKRIIIKEFGCDPNSIFEFNYFENDPEACIINARKNPKPGGTENFIRTYTKIYRIPENSNTYKVYKENV